LRTLHPTHWCSRQDRCQQGTQARSTEGIVRREERSLCCSGTRSPQSTRTIPASERTECTRNQESEAGRWAPSRITAEIRRTALALSPVEPILALHARMVASAGPYKPASDRFRTPQTRCVGRRVARSKVCARRAVESRAGRAVASQRPIISVDADVVASSNPSELACGLAARQALGVIVRRALGLEIARKADEIRAQSALLIASKKITVRAHIRAAVGPIDRAVDRRNRASNTPRIVCTPTFGRIPARRAAHHRARRALCFVEPVAGAALKRTSRRPVVRPNRRSIGTRQAHSVADGSRSAAARIEARDAG